MPSARPFGGVIATDLRARRADWRGVVVSSLVAGAVLLFVDVGARALVEPASTWATPRHIAALLMGERALAGGTSPELGVITLALVLHAMLSLVYGMVLDLATRRLTFRHALLGGLVFGCALYLFNYHVMTAIFTSFAQLRGVIALSAHAAFGVTVVAVRAELRRGRAAARRPHPTAIERPTEARVQPVAPPLPAPRALGSGWRGRVVVVTGASAGVGRAVVRAFAARGADVALIARGIDGLEGARREVEQTGGRALVLPLDVADAAAVARARDQIERVLGPIDVWVNDAMVSVFAPIVDTTPEEFRRVTEVTYLGYVHGTLAALQAMRARDRGTIVQVSSALAYRSIPLQAAYCAAKHAVKGFTESLRTELRHERSNVHVTSVNLPAINTPQFEWSRAKLPNEPQPVPPIFQPELAADAVVYAAEHRRREIWLAWPTVKAIMGEKIAPKLADRYLAEHGFESQQTEEPIDRPRRDNLYEPVAGDHGAHGTFDSRARTFSAVWWLSKHRHAIFGAAGLALVASSAWAYAARR